MPVEGEALDFSIHLFRPVSEGTLTAKGKIVNAGKRMFVAEAELFDSDGQLAAHGVELLRPQQDPPATTHLTNEPLRNGGPG